MTTLTIVNAIINVGNSIITAVTGSGSSENKDNLKKCFEDLRELLLPDDVDRREDRDKKIMDLLEKEMAQGPIKVRPMATNRKSKGRIRRRGNVDGSEQPQS